MKRAVLALVAMLPLASLAQDAKPAEPPKPATPTFQFYGFAHLAAQWMGGTSNVQEYPQQAVENQSTGGSFIESARQSRVGLKVGLDDGNWTGATLSSVIEFDFNTGSYPTLAFTGPNTTATTAPTAARSNAYYNGLMRLRHANATATWKVPTGTIAVEAGQDWDLVNNVTAESIAYQATPLFGFAGNLFRRAPQIRVTSANYFDDFGVSLQLAALSPSDGSNQPFDNGLGNKSRQPDLEGRLALSYKGDIGGTVGVGYLTTKRRFNAGQADQTDVTASLLGVDADLNLTKYLNLRGEYFSDKGTNDSFNGIGPGTIGVANVAAPASAGPNTALFNPATIVAVRADGYWGQAILKPCPEAWVTFGYGTTKVNQDDWKKAKGASALAATDRVQQDMFDSALIINAGKAWRFGLEYAQTTSKYVPVKVSDLASIKIQQVSLASQFRF